MQVTAKDQVVKAGTGARSAGSIVLCLLLLIWSVSVVAQNALDGFNPEVDGQVNAMVVQSDGRILIAGDFSTVNGTAAARLARLHVDGSVDESFVAGPINGQVFSLALQADDGIIVGGAFTEVAGEARPHLARISADGQLDMAFDPQPDGWVRTLRVQADGRILTGGSFTHVGGTVRGRVARLLPDGELDAAFDPGAGADGTVRSILAQADGAILLGGEFLEVGGAARPYLARLLADGSLDNTFDTMVDHWVTVMATQADGRVVLGGTFFQVGGSGRPHLARLHPDGSVDTDFNPGVAGSFASAVWSLSVQADGRILAGGEFTEVGGLPRANLVRLAVDGTVDTTFTPSVDLPAFSLMEHPDGRILVGGLFTTVNGLHRPYVSRLHSDGRLDRNFAEGGVNGWVRALAVQPDGRILLGGEFTDVHGHLKPPARIARLHVDGTPDTSFDPGAGADSNVNAIAVQADGKVLISGLFGAVDGVARTRIARLDADGTLDQTFNPTIVGHAVYALAVQHDGGIVIAGSFSAVNGAPRNRVARLFPDGSLDEDFDTGPGDDGAIYNVALQADGRILVGGAFSQIGGQPRANIARLLPSGLLDESFNPAVDNTVLAMAVQPDGAILLGGNFETVAGEPMNRIARIGADGSLDSRFTPGLGADARVYGIALQSDGKLIINGLFINIDGQQRVRIARLLSDGGVDPGFDLGMGFASGLPQAIARQADGRVVVAGSFTDVGGEPRSRITRLSTPEAAVRALAITGAGNGVRWSRGGTAPALGPVVFEWSDNHIDWEVLGTPSADGGDWILNDVPLPMNSSFWVRARGTVQNGTGSASIEESIRTAFLRGYLVTAVTAAGKGTVSPDQQEVVADGDAVLTVTPDVGWQVEAITGDTCAPLDNADGTWTAAGIAAPCLIEAVFKPGEPLPDAMFDDRFESR